MLTSDVKTLNLDDEIRNDQGNALIVQDGYSYWLQSYLSKIKDAQEYSVALAKIPASIPEARKDLHRHFKGVHQSVLGPTVDA